MLTNATEQQLNKALSIVNERYDNNISFHILEPKGRKISFRLAAKSKLRGARVSFSGRNVPFASWHVHGEFFDNLFEIDPNIYVKSMGKMITKDAGNWQDRNVGSIVCPMMFSESSIF